MKFAKANGLGSAEVNSFLEQYNQPKTLEDIQKIPENLLTHYDWIGEPHKAIYEFIREEMYLERHQTVDLESLLDSWYDKLYDVTGHDNIDGVEIENYDNKAQQEITVLLEVRDAIIETKFGSVVNDW